MISKVEAKPIIMEGKRKREASRKGPCTLRGNNPRIFRVSPLFGGKDRHSKVCTIKGLRDRRIRLSTSTAVQVYDLQNKLGLTQPSKAIDRLIHVTRFEIDDLPPLIFPKDFDPNPSILPQVCHLMPKSDENERLLLQNLSPLPNIHASSSSSSVFIQSNSMDESCCHIDSSSILPFPLADTNSTSFSSPSARLLFGPLMMLFGLV